MARCDLDWVRERLATHLPQPIGHDVAPRRAAVAIIARPTDDGVCALLFIRRSTNADDPWSGHMAFPGGRVEADDASALDAARREAREEVGLDLEREAELIGQVDDVRASARGGVIPMAITPFVFHLRGCPETQLERAEVEEALWIPVARLLDPANVAIVPYELHGQRYDLPAFDIDGRVIWGLTYQMLLRLFLILDWEAPFPPRR